MPTIRWYARMVAVAEEGHPLFPSSEGRKEASMLVLSRKRGESIVIDDEIVVTVVEIRGDRVRLGIQAPKEMSVHRDEVYAAIQAEQAKVPASAEPDQPASAD